MIVKIYGYNLILKNYNFIGLIREYLLAFSCNRKVYNFELYPRNDNGFQDHPIYVCQHFRSNKQKKSYPPKSDFECQGEVVVIQLFLDGTFAKLCGFEFGRYRIGV